MTGPAACGDIVRPCAGLRSSTGHKESEEQMMDGGNLFASMTVVQTPVILIGSQKSDAYSGSDGVKALGETWTSKSVEPAEVDASDPLYRVMTDTHGGTYKGQVDPETAEFHGRGHFSSWETTAIGEWHQGKLHGLALQTWEDGRRYEGQHRHGFFGGHGRMEWQHPRGKMIYEGQYLDDQKHGEGRFVWPSGRSYEGQWVRGNREGIGIDTSATGAKCSGVWEDDVFLHPAEEQLESVELPCKDGEVTMREV